MAAGTTTGEISYGYALQAIEGALTLALRTARMVVSDELVEALERARSTAREEYRVMVESRAKPKAE